MSYHNFRRLLLEAREKAGIKKDVRPHLLRHARLTELAKVLPEQKLKKWAGWTQGSNMASIYIHLSGKDLDEDFKQLHGLPTEKMGPALKGELSPKECPRCKAMNPATHMYCLRCGMALDEKESFKAIEREKQPLDQIIASERAEFLKLIEETTREEAKAIVSEFLEPLKTELMDAYKEMRKGIKELENLRKEVDAKIKLKD